LSLYSSSHRRALTFREVSLRRNFKEEPVDRGLKV